MSGGIFDLLGIDFEGNGVIDERTKKRRREAPGIAAVEEGVATPEEGLLINGLLGLTAPVDPGKDFREYMGSQDGAKGFFGSVLNPILSRAIFSDEYDDYKTAKSKYATDQALFDIAVAGQTKRAENSAGDEQLEALAALFPDNPTLQARIEAGLTNANSFDPMTLSPGQIAVSPIDAGLFAQGLPKVEPDNRTAPERTAQGLAAAVGLDLSQDENGNYVNKDHAQAYAGLLSAAARGTVTQHNADGSQTHVNHITSALDHARQVAGQGVQTSTGNGANPNAGSSPGGISAGLSTVATEQNKQLAQDVTGAREKVGVADKVLGTLDRLGTRNQNEDGSYSFQPLQPVNEVYGSVNALYPDALRGEEESDVIAEIELLTNTLSVEERQKLQGQGQITEGEQKMLSNSITALQRKGFGEGKISDAKVAEHLNIIYDVMERARERARGMQQAGGQPVREGEYTLRTNFKGMSDDAFDAEIPYLRPGSTYTLPDGSKLKWDGEGFVKP